MDEKLSQLSPQQKRELLQKLLREKQIAESSETAGSVREFPLSAGQRALWFGYRRDPRQTAYNVFLPSRFHDAMDLQRLERAVDRLVKRHDALRTTFAEHESDNHPVQRVASMGNHEFRVIDCESWSSEKLNRRVLAETQRPFDLTTGPLLRVACFRVRTDDIVIVATTHHIVVDFWSLVLMMSEIEFLYREQTLPRASSRYAEFVRTQDRTTNSPDGDRLRDYWRSKLAGVSPRLQLATDFPRPKQFTHRASVQPFRLESGVVEKIAALARRLNVTENAIVLALVQALLARFSSQDSFTVGTPFSGRLKQDFESTVGFFVNVLPIVADLSQSPTLSDLSRQVGRSMVDALANEALPFSDIVKTIKPARDNSHHPLFQVSCTFEKSHLTEEQGRAGFLLGDEGASRQFAGMRQEAYFVEHPTCHYDLEFVFEFTRTHLRGMVCYCRDLFVPSTIETLIQQFESLVTEALARPETPLHQLPWSLSQLPEPPTAVQAETIPRHLAKVDGKFLADARAFACRLLERGVERGHFVPVIFPRGRDAWIAILGLQWIGAIPIPIDADGPAVKLETILADTGFRKIVAEEQPPNWVRECDQPLISLADSQVGVVSELDATGPVPTDAAYVIYTSGSTGQPKGVRVSHAAICNTLAWRRRSVQLSSNDRVLILLSHQFDASMAVVLTTIGQGARPIWYRKDSSGFDLDQLVEQIIEDQITVLPAVPSLLKAVASHRRFEECTSLREIWSGGESITHDLIEKYRETLGCSIWNFYGPTEAAVEATAIHATHCDTSYAVPIGYPIDNVQVLVVDELYRPVPNGVPGQLAIAGAGLADGYQNRSDLTASAFVTLNDGHARRRIYLTGDRGRIRTDGAIEFLGRLDDQVKVNGYRIELDEIDAILQQFPEVARGAVALRNETLVAFVEFDEGIQAKDRSVRLRRFLADKLPTYKRPSRVVFVDRLPLSSSGKVQRSKLASFAIEDAPTNVDRSPLEQYVHEAFVKHLDVDHLSDDENFFEAGGTSLQAAILTSDLSQDLGFSVPSSMLFDLGDVQAVSARLAELHPQAITGRFGDESLIVSRQRRSELRMDSLLADFSREAPDHTSKNHVFMIHPPGGIVICYRELARELRPDRSLVAVRSRGLHGDEPLPLSLAEMAREYVDAIRSRQPEGPYLVGGWSLGGVIAYEVARQICESKAVVDQLILIDSTVPEESDPDSAKVGQEYGLDFSLKQLAAMSPEEQLPFLYEHAERIGVLEDGAPEVVINKFLQDLRRLFSCHVDLCRNYQLETLDVPVTLFRPNEVSGIADARLDRGWGKWVRSVDVHYVSGHHHSMVQAQGAAEMSHQLRRSSTIKGPTQTL